MKILILGSNGQLGRSISEIIPCYLKKFEYSKDQLSITDNDKLFETYKKIDPDLVINCAAYTKVDLAEEEKKKAKEINHKAIKNLVRLCNKFKSTLIHFSTDYVYDGKKNTPYLESDKEAPLNFYGLSKKHGDDIIIKTCKKYFIFRLSGVFSPYGENFVKSMLRLRDKRSIKVVNDQYLRPTSARMVGKFLLDNLKKKKFETSPYGLYNFSSDDNPMSWNDFAKLIFEEAISMNLVKTIPEILMISSKEFDAKAVRPPYSVLDNSKIRQNFLFPKVLLTEVLKKDLPLIFSRL